MKFYLRFLFAAVVTACLISLPLSSRASAGTVSGAIERALAERIEVQGGRAAGRTAEEIAVRSELRREALSAKTACRAIANKCFGLSREQAAARILSDRYPHERLQPETYLLARNGRRAIDPVTRTGRRIDFVMFGDGSVSRRFEITSQFANKTSQIAKERRIFSRRANGLPRTGGIYVRDRTTGELVVTRDTIPTHTMRLH